MKKKWLTAFVCIAAAAAMALPVFANDVPTPRGQTPVTNDAIIRNVADSSQILTVASASTPGINDEVWTWTDRNMTLTQRWDFVAVGNQYGHYLICPEGNKSLALNVYRAGDYPCTMFTAGGSNLADTEVTIGGTQGNYDIYNLANGRYLARTSTPKYKFADGYGYGTNWVYAANTQESRWKIEPSATS